MRGQARSPDPSEDSQFYKPLDPLSREAQMVALAENEAERRLREGTASSQIIEHYLKLGTRRTELELAKLERENQLLDAKAEALRSEAHMEELYGKVLNAMRTYGGVFRDVEDF